MNTRISTTTTASIVTCVVLGVVLFIVTGFIGLAILVAVGVVVEGGRFVYRKIRPARVEAPLSDEELAATFGKRD